MNHEEIHKLERDITDVLERYPEFTRATAILAAHDVAEMLADHYRVDALPVEDDGIRQVAVSEALEKISKSFTEIAQDLSKWCGVTGEEKR